MVPAYGSRAYAQTLMHVGSPRWMHRAGGSLLSRAIAGRPYHDLVGPYPWAEFDDWSGLDADFREISAADDPPLSVVTVISPTTSASETDLQRAFPDHLTSFKQHHLLDLTADFELSYGSSHRRKMRRARERVSVEVLVDATEISAEWVLLYGQLVDRHQITGPASFPEDALRGQLALPGSIACVARLGTEIVGVITFFVGDAVASYHLGAFSPAGYEHEVAFALFPSVFDHLAASGISLVNLGGGAGNSVQSDDGLVRFKRGWATHARPSLLGGRVLDRVAYASLTDGLDRGFFPAYRGDRKQ